MTWQHSGGLGNNSTLKITSADTAFVDSFFRQRMNTPFTIFDSKQIWKDPDLANNVEMFPLFWDNQETSGGGTSTLFNLNRASTTLSVSANTAGTRTRQTRQRFNYQPGKSLVTIKSGNLGNQPAGIKSRLGYFDDNNGLYFQNNGGTLEVVRRSNVSGTVAEEIFAQADWNLDTMDRSANSPSGKFLDPAKSQIWFMDFEWLGVGRIRFGLFLDGVPIYIHQMLHANDLSSVYMSTPNLPVRAEIINDGSGPAASLEQMCSTVISEGGVNPNGVFRSNNLGALAASEIQAAAINTAYAVAGIRLKPNYLSADIREVDISVVETTGGSNPFLWSVHFNPTLTSGLTYTDQLRSGVQFGVGDADPADALTDNGFIIHSGYASGSTKNVQVDLGSALRLGSLIDGTPDEIVLAVTPITTNQDILASLSWREVW